MFRRTSAAAATSREGHRSRDCSLGTRQQPVLRLFQDAPRPHRDCRSLLQLLKCEHTLQSVSDRRRPQTNILVRRGLLLREHALACQINLKAIDDALHNAAPDVPDDGFE